MHGSHHVISFYLTLCSKRSISCFFASSPRCLRALHWSVNVLSTKALIGDIYFRLLLETGPPILLGHASHAKV